MAASGDSAAAYNTLGPGLERRDDGLLEVTDPTQAYLQVAADGSSEYVRIVPVSDEVMGGVPAGSRVLRTVRVRADADRVAGSLCSVSLDSSRSLYVRAAAGRTVRVQVVEPKGSLIPFDAVRANVRAVFGESVACGVVGVGDGVGGVVASGLAPVEGAVEYVECASACDVGRVVDGSWVGDCCGGGVAVGVCGAVEFSYGWHVYV